MQPVTDELLEDIVDRLVEALHPQAIYLFGSHASGKAHPHSDVDLLVVVDDDAGDLYDLAGRGYVVLPNTGVALTMASTAGSSRAWRKSCTHFTALPCCFSKALALANCLELGSQP